MICRKTIKFYYWKPNIKKTTRIRIKTIKRVQGVEQVIQSTATSMKSSVAFKKHKRIQLRLKIIV